MDRGWASLDFSSLAGRRYRVMWALGDNFHNPDTGKNFTYRVLLDTRAVEQVTNSLENSGK